MKMKPLGSTTLTQKIEAKLFLLICSYVDRFKTIHFTAELFNKKPCKNLKLSFEKIYNFLISNNLYISFFSIWVFFHKHLQFTGKQGKGEVVISTFHYHFHLLHRHLDISWAITVKSSPLHIASSQIRTGNLWCLSESC